MQRLVSRRRRFLPSDFGTDTVWWPRSRIALLSGHGERWLLKKKKIKKKDGKNTWKRNVRERKRWEWWKAEGKKRLEGYSSLVDQGQSYVMPGCPFVCFIRHSVSSYRFHLAGTVLNRASEQQRRGLSGWLSACFTTRNVLRVNRSVACFMHKGKKKQACIDWGKDSFFFSFSL